MGMQNRQQQSCLLPRWTCCDMFRSARFLLPLSLSAFLHRGDPNISGFGLYFYAPLASFCQARWNASGFLQL